MRNVPFPLNACTVIYLVGIILTLVSSCMPNLQPDIPTHGVLAGGQVQALLRNW